MGAEWKGACDGEREVVKREVIERRKRGGKQIRKGIEMRADGALEVCYLLAYLDWYLTPHYGAAPWTSQ